MELRNELEEQERNEAVALREQFESNINNIWGHSHLGMEAKSAAMSMLSTKTGMYARVPITCKTDGCPYESQCVLLPYGLAPLGEKCPWETALIETRYAGYMSDYDLDNASYTDQTLISELINLDVMLERTKALIAKEGLQITEVIAGMTESGEQYTRPEVSKTQELYDRHSNRRDKILDLMMGTRKAKKGSTQEDMSVMDLLSGAINTTEFIVEERPDNIK
ncbi:hypothetical protein [Paraclostridium dentum]|uniref:hypothetical protein n=1 Tax=Paraclostridium dentum TaxID=2662455 RepID=UPI003F2DB745